MLTRNALRYIRSFRSTSDRVKLENDFRRMIIEMVIYKKITVAELESVIDICPDILEPYKCCDSGRTPLHEACWYESLNEVIELLVRRYPDALRIVDKHGCLPLHYIHKGCKFSTVKLMVDTYPLSVQVLSNDGQTPLHCACGMQCSIEVIEYLVGLYPQAMQMKDMYGKTPFHKACYHGNLLVVQLLHTLFPLAARWEDDDRETPLAVAYSIVKHGGSRKVMEYVAYECWPVACSLLYLQMVQRDQKPEKCLKDVTTEVVAALVDVAFHVKRILPNNVIACITEVVTSFVDKNKSTSSSLMLSPSQRCDLVLDKSDRCRMKLDDRTVLSVVKNNNIADLLEPEDGHDELQELIDNVIRMNRAGRAYFEEDPENKRQGMKMLQMSATSLNGLYYHIRENPLLCK